MGTKSGLRQRLFRAVHAEAARRKLDHDALHDMVLARFKKPSMAKLTDGELLMIYRDWTGHGLKQPGRLPRKGEVAAGVPAEMIDPKDLEMMAAEFAKRGMSDHGRQAFLRRQLRGRDVLRTRRDVVKVTAALRAMNRREGL